MEGYKKGLIESSYNIKKKDIVTVPDGELNDTLAIVQRVDYTYEGGRKVADGVEVITIHGGTQYFSFAEISMLNRVEKEEVPLKIRRKLESLLY